MGGQTTMRLITDVDSDFATFQCFKINEHVFGKQIQHTRNVQCQQKIYACVMVRLMYFPHMFFVGQIDISLLMLKLHTYITITFAIKSFDKQQ